MWTSVCVCVVFGRLIKKFSKFSAIKQLPLRAQLLLLLLLHLLLLLLLATPVSPSWQSLVRVQRSTSGSATSSMISCLWKFPKFLKIPGKTLKNVEKPEGRVPSPPIIITFHARPKETIVSSQRIIQFFNCFSTPFFFSYFNFLFIFIFIFIWFSFISFLCFVSFGFVCNL